MSTKRIEDAAWLSSLAHMNKDQIAAALPSKNYSYVDFISIDSMQCYVAKCSEGEVVVFRETEGIIINGKINWEGLKDWLRNFNFLPKNTAYGVMHKGFYEILMKARKKIMDNITDKNFYCIGFSQGASLSRMFAHIITKREVLSGYKPFFIAFEPAMESKTNNYNPYGIYTTKGNDPVPLIPLALTGWNHSGEHIHFTGKRGRALINPKKYRTWLDRVADTIMDVDDRLDGEKVPMDHNIFRIRSEYLEEKNKAKLLKLAKEKFDIC